MWSTAGVEASEQMVNVENSYCGGMGTGGECRVQLVWRHGNRWCTWSTTSNIRELCGGAGAGSECLFGFLLLYLSI